MAILSFACHDTKIFFEEGGNKKFSNFARVLERKLSMLNSAVLLKDLMSPPNNNLHELNKDRVGQHSININDKYRICFVWTSEGPKNVEVVDYH